MNRPAGLEGLPVNGYMHNAVNGESSVLVGDSQNQDSDPFGVDANYYAQYQSQAGPSNYESSQSQPFQATQEYSQTQPATQPVASGPSASPPACWAALLPNCPDNPRCVRIQVEGWEPETVHCIGRSAKYKQEQDNVTQWYNTDTVIENPRISGQHCKIWREFETHVEGAEYNALVKIQDFSTNGTYVRGTKLGKGKITILHHGDEVCFGPKATKGATRKDEFRYTFTIEPHLLPRSRSDPSVAGGLFVKYDVQEQLGKGSFAVVHKAIDKDTGAIVAIKIINKLRFTKDKKSRQMLKREVQIMTKILHEYIVQYIDGYEDTDYLYLVLEYVDGGDLLDFITSKRGLAESEAAEVAVMMSEALAYLHQQNIVHRDLKPENILMTRGEHPICKIADFGLAKVAHESVAKTMCGTPAYLAPEVILQDPRARGYSAAVDSWSMGVIIYACLMNASPFPPEDENVPLHIRMQSREANYADLLESSVSDEAIDFINRLLDRNPATRMTPYDALKHPWLQPCISRRMSSNNASALIAAPLPPHKTSNPQSHASLRTSEQTTPVRPAPINVLAAPTTDPAPRTAVPHPTNGAGPDDRTSDPGPANGHSANGAVAAAAPEDEEGNDSDAYSYSQRMGKMNINSEAAPTADGEGEADAAEMIEDSMDTSRSNGFDFQHHRARQETAETSRGDLESELSMPPSSSSAIKRKLPPSAFSSESSINSQDPALVSVSSSALSSAVHRFEPDAPFLQHMPMPGMLQPGNSSVISTTNEKTPTKADPVPYRPPSPTSSLSSLSSLSEVSDAEEPTSPRRATAHINGSSSSRGDSVPAPLRKPSNHGRRRSTRSTKNYVASYADSESESDPDFSSSLSKSRSKKPQPAAGRARKQRRISAQA